MPATHRHDRGLRAIALFKRVKAALVILAGTGTLSLLSLSTEQRLREWLAAFTTRPGSRIIERMLHALNVATPAKLTFVGVASICDGLLFAVEGTGLWLEKRWAEYFTIVVTGLLIPLEVYELAQQVSATRVLALVVNAAAVAYLVYRVRHHRRGEEMR